MPDDYLVAPPVQLAFWLVDNWWRIRWECHPDLRDDHPNGGLLHELSAIGGGMSGRAWLYGAKTAALE